jgi:molybdopterin converting factor small subunit
VSTVTVQLFASYAEAFGDTKLEVPVTSDTTVGDLVSTICALPAGRLLGSSPRLAVNRKFVGADQHVGPSDEIALIPPVAGG